MSRANFTPEQFRALYFHWLREYREADDAVEAAKQERRRISKQARAEGIKAELLAFGVRSLNMDDPGSLVDILVGQAAILHDLGVIRQPIPRDDLFADRRPIEEKAKDEGEIAGRLNKPPKDNPYDASGPNGQAWLAGYHDGQAAQKRDLEQALIAASESDGNADIEGGAGTKGAKAGADGDKVVPIGDKKSPAKTTSRKKK